MAPAPTGFRVMRQYQISATVTIVTFTWNQGMNDELHYEFAVSPNPLVPVMNSTLRSPFNVTLVPFAVYSASLFAINCVGRSLPSTRQVGKFISECMLPLFVFSMYTFCTLSE